MSAGDRARVDELARRLRILASTLEIHACVQEDSESRRSAAFVAATAHRFLFEAAGVLELPQRPRLSLSRDAVSSDISAALLFLAAGFPADASEVIGAYDRLRTGEPTAPIVRAVWQIAVGRLEPILNLSILPPDGSDEDVQAEFALWARTMDAATRMATRLLTEPTTFDDSWETIRNGLEGVRALSAERVDLAGLVPEGTQVFSTYPGPHHLATLLLAASRGLDGGALADAPPPTGEVPPDLWKAFIRIRTRTKPYLWANHMEALQAGLLDAGKSAVINFPTGAGKSTMSELKVAAVIASGRKVIYLAPTLALVGQVASNLRDLIPASMVEQVEHEDGLFAELEALEGEDATVMTPERCLLLLGLFPDRFADVGLVVFDECHLLHCDEEVPDRRSLDAMLCLLKLFEASPDADVLLISAMVKNGRELGEWLREAHDKDVLVFDGAWKPTRQARASLVFSETEIDGLWRILRAVPKGKNLPQAQMRAVAHTVVCLKQHWATNRLADYRVLRLLGSTTKLKAARGRNGTPYPTIDAKAAAIDVATQAAARGLKTIVFVQNPRSVPSCVKLTGKGAAPDLTPEERAVYDAAATELGGPEFVFAPSGIAGGHFGLLTPLERSLVEGSFKRAGGISVLFSTNTLAQGMNLPADLVVIARTGAYDAQADKYKQVDTHDLLNAAGRAGRAGLAANGFVLVIPDRLVTFDKRGRVSGSGLRSLKDDILAQDDRCLAIVDPIEVLLDHCQLAEPATLKLIDSLAIRLPADAVEAGATSALRFLKKSFAASRAAKAEQLDGFDLKVEALVERRGALLAGEPGTTAANLAAATGWNPRLIARLVEAVGNLNDPAAMGAYAWAEWALRWLAQTSEALEALRFDERFPIEHLSPAFRAWLQGRPLRDVELALGTAADKLGHLERARLFAKSPVRDVSYFVGLIAQIAGSTDLELREDLIRSASTAALLIREGLDSPEKVFLLQRRREALWTRVRAQTESAEWLSRVPPADSMVESFAESKRRTNRGITEFERLRNA